MHTDLSKHLHSNKCNELIQLLENCHNDNPFKKFFGVCNSEDAALVRCLKEERQLKQRRNFEKSLEAKRRWQQRAREQEAQQ